VLLAVAGAFPLSAGAHDIPNARVDRSIQATLNPVLLEIDYEVSLSELTLTRDLRMLIGALPGSDRRDWFQSYGRETGPLNAKGLLCSIDGRTLGLRMRGFDLVVEDHPRFVFHFETPIPARGRLTIHDTNYSDSEGTSRLGIRARDGVTISGDALPGDVESIAIRPVWQLSDEEERRSRQVTIEYTGPPATSSRPGSAPLLRTRPPARQAAVPARQASRLTELLDRSAGGVWAALGLGLMAAGLGAVHALQPGHGKTLVAATVLGEGGHWVRGVIVALVTTLTHTGSVLLVALGLWLTQSGRYGEIHLGLAHAAGFLIAAIGLWRLGRHVGRHGEHGQLAQVEADEPGELAPGKGLVGLGVAGGLVPCWDAVVLILMAEATGRLLLGVVLLLAFGMGMAAVLVAVGVAAGRIRGLVSGGNAPVESPYGSWERRLGIASGLVLAAIGVYLLSLA
jgi:ABC-type nickel/cobalt efflux system permease component RcnA